VTPKGESVVLNSAHIQKPKKAIGLVTLDRPREADFAAQLEHIHSKSFLRFERKAEIHTQATNISNYFSQVIGLDSSHHKYTGELVALALNTAFEIIMQFKFLFAVRRPFEISSAIQPMLPNPGHGAYPSGHATEAFLLATLFEKLIEKKNGGADDPRSLYLKRLAARITDNRTVAGLHFPLDNVAGMYLGTALGEYFCARFAGEKTNSTVNSRHMDLITSGDNKARTERGRSDLPATGNIADWLGYDDWNFKQRPGTKGSDELLIPVMMRFDLPQNRTQEDWDEYLQKGLNDIIKLTEDNLRTAIKDPEGSLNNQSLLSGGDLSAFERILKEAKVDVGPNASIRDILGQDGPRSTLAKWLAGQTDATLHYLSIIQVYFTEAFLFEKYEQPNDEEPQHQSPPDERKEETGKEHLEGLGEILFTGQPIALNTFSQFRNGTQGLPRIEPSGDKKVMLGVIDGGFPFLHDRLRHETTGKTLIERLWVQQIDELSIAANFGVSNGVTLTQKNIDKIIDELIRLDDSELTAYALDVRDTLELEAAVPIKPKVRHLMRSCSALWSCLSKSHRTHQDHCLGLITCKPSVS